MRRGATPGESAAPRRPWRGIRDRMAHRDRCRGLLPLFHSPDYDLVADLSGRLLRIEVKTSTCVKRPGHYVVQIATSGGNQSWNGTVKRFSAGRCDYLFVLVADGRRWFIPAEEIQATTSLTLGGARYGEFEVASGVGRLGPSRIVPKRGGAGVGEPGRPVKSVPKAEWVRIPPPPSALADDQADLRMGSGRTRASANRQITIPKRAFEAASLSVGDRLRVDALGSGRLSVVRVDELAALHASRLHGNEPRRDRSDEPLSPGCGAAGPLGGP
jgi:hypothetical protein